MIASSGYNIVGPEVESALLAHEAVSECAVVVSPDAERSQIVKAFIVLLAGKEQSANLARSYSNSSSAKSPRSHIRARSSLWTLATPSCKSPPASSTRASLL